MNSSEIINIAENRLGLIYRDDKFYHRDNTPATTAEINYLIFLAQNEKKLKQNQSIPNIKTYNYHPKNNEKKLSLKKIAATLGTVLILSSPALASARVLSNVDPAPIVQTIANNSVLEQDANLLEEQDIKIAAIEAQKEEEKAAQDLANKKEDFQNQYMTHQEDLKNQEAQAIAEAKQDTLNNRDERLDEVTALHQSADGVGSQALGDGYSMSNSGCCISSVAGIYYLYSGDMPDIETFIQNIKDAGGWSNGNGSGMSMFADEDSSPLILDKYGLSGHTISEGAGQISIDEVINILNNGHKILISVKSPTFGGMSSGHYIVMDHYNPDLGEIYVYNPGGAEGYYDLGVIQNDLINCVNTGMWDIAFTSQKEKSLEIKQQQLVENYSALSNSVDAAIGQYDNAIKQMDLEYGSTSTASTVENNTPSDNSTPEPSETENSNIVTPSPEPTVTQPSSEPVITNNEITSPEINTLSGDEKRQQILETEGYLRGIDICESDNLDWSVVADSNDVDFAIIRVNKYNRSTNRSDALDEGFTNNIESCNQYDIPAGVYVYTYAATPEDAAIEAQTACDSVQPYELSMPIFIDIEEQSPALLQDNGSEIIQSFVDTCQANGYVVGIYCGGKDANLITQNGTLFQDLPLWCARYQNTKGMPINDIEPSNIEYSGTNMILNQPSENGELADGSVVDVDLMNDNLITQIKQANVNNLNTGKTR